MSYPSNKRRKEKRMQIKRILIGLACLAISSQALTVIDNPPSDSIIINVSNHSVNRLVLPSRILDVSYSKEKSVDIKVVDNQAFIKYQPVLKQRVRTTGRGKEEVVGQPETVYDRAESSEIYFITQSKTYSIVLNPQDMEAETIVINDFASSKEEILKYETDDPFVATMGKLSKSVFVGGVPSGYKTKKINKVLQNTTMLETTELNIHSGVLFSVAVLEVRNKTNKALKLNPKSYIKFAKESPKAVSIFYDNEVNHLLPYSKATVVIITKAVK